MGKTKEKESEEKGEMSANEVLYLVRRSLKTPEGHDIIKHARKIMKENQQLKGE